jgi:hypothetical protein
MACKTSTYYIAMATSSPSPTSPLADGTLLLPVLKVDLPSPNSPTISPTSTPQTTPPRRADEDPWLSFLFGHRTTPTCLRHNRSSRDIGNCPQSLLSSLFYCGMDNPDQCDAYEEYSEPIITTTSNEVISVEDSPPSLQSTSTSRVSLDKTSEIARQQSISRTKQMKPELNVHTRAPRCCPARCLYLRASQLTSTSIGGLFLMQSWT